MKGREAYFFKAKLEGIIQAFVGRLPHRGLWGGAYFVCVSASRIGLCKAYKRQ